MFAEIVDVSNTFAHIHKAVADQQRNAHVQGNMDDLVFRPFPDGSEKSEAILDMFNYVHYQQEIKVVAALVEVHVEKADSVALSSPRQGDGIVRNIKSGKAGFGQTQRHLPENLAGTTTDFSNGMRPKAMLIEHSQNLPGFPRRVLGVPTRVRIQIAAIAIDRPAHVDSVMSKNWKVTYPGHGHNASLPPSACRRGKQSFQPRSVNQPSC